jgi:ADP-ribose pyrophosphatase YjhB (NUDIX family)
MRLGAFAVIFDEQDRVLLCHRRDIDAWNLPGGLVADGESPWDAALREVREEVGLETEITRLTGLYYKPGSDEVVFNFECRILSGTPTTSDEADAVEYFAVHALPPNTAPKQIERIADALTRLPVPYLKVQSGPGTRDLIEARQQ